MARTYLSELKNIRLRLEECEQRLVSRIQSPSSARADGDAIQENALRIAEQEVRPAAGSWAGEGRGGHRSKNSCGSSGVSAWARGVGFEGISPRRRQQGKPQQVGSLLHFLAAPLPRAILLFPCLFGALPSRSLPPSAAHAGGSAAAAVGAAGGVREVLQLPGQGSCGAQHAPAAFRAGLGGEQDGADAWAVFHLPGEVSRDVPLFPDTLLSVPTSLKALFCASSTPRAGRIRVHPPAAHGAASRSLPQRGCHRAASV